jgi:hypothetical protein
MKARRIVAGFDWRERRNARLEALARLADELQAELIGLFVEDIGLLHLAALPFGREVGFPSAARRELDVKGLERAFEAQANELRRACEAVFATTTVSWSFRVARGEQADQLLSAAIEADAPTLLVPPGTDPRAEAAVVSRTGLEEDSLRKLLATTGRPVLLVP